MEEIETTTIVPAPYDPKRILDKTQRELTVGDELKLQGIYTAVTVGVCAAAVGVMYGISKIADRRAAKKAAKAEKKLETVKEDTTTEKEETPTEN